MLGRTVIGAAGLALLAAAPNEAAAQSSPARKCRPLKVDVANGTVNGLGPATPLATVKRKLPCFTGATAEGEFYNNGGGIFYREHNLYFYTYLRFIELRAPFDGAMTIPVFGRDRASLMAEFRPTGRQGRPIWGTPDDEFVTTRTGCTQISFTEGRAVRLRFYTRPCGELFQPR